MDIKEVYNKYKHITVLRDKKIMETTALHLCLYELWQAVEEKLAEKPKEEITYNCKEHSCGQECMIENNIHCGKIACKINFNEAVI